MNTRRRSTAIPLRSSEEFHHSDTAWRQSSHSDVSGAREKPGVRFLHARFLAQGGFATVYKAIDSRTGDTVALKVARPTPLVDSEERLSREAFVYRAVTNPHIARFFGEIDFQGSPAIALEYLPGDSLARRLVANALDVAAAIETTHQMLEALHSLHCAGIVHCDINPGNVLFHVSEDGTPEIVKLIDFGISKSFGETSQIAGMVFGTLPYMAPEQLRAQSVSVATDLYSTGVLLYAMVTGRLPFDATTERGGRDAILTQVPVAPTVLRPRCPIELERFIMRALAKEAGFRFQSAREMQRELDWISARNNYPRGAEAMRRSSSVRPRATSLRELFAMTTRRLA